MCVCEWKSGGVAGNYTTLQTVISGREKRGTAMLGTWDVGEDGAGLACVICDFYLGHEDQ